jgi:hypothetical protein
MHQERPRGAATIFTSIRSCITPRAAVLALVALTVSCGDVPTAPSPEVRPEPDFIVVTHTTDIAAHGSAAAVHRVTEDTLRGEVRSAKVPRVAIGATAPSPRSAPVIDPNDFDASRLPTPSISFPARFETAMCGGLPTYSLIESGPQPGTTIEMTGTGDAPPSSLTLVQAGRVVATVERSWIRTSHAWQMSRQVTTAAEGKYRDVVTYQHRTAHGASATNAIPVASCSAPPLASGMSAATASRGYYAPRMMPPAGVSRDYGVCTDDADYYSIDPCFDKRLDVYKADAALVVASAAAAAACLIPEPATPVACTLAGAAYLTAVANLKFAQMSLDNCRAQAAAKKCSCVNQTVRVPSGTTGFIPTPSLDCSVDDPWGDAISSSSVIGPQDLSGPNCNWEVWEISYDGGQTWSYYGTFWVCYANVE